MKLNEFFKWNNQHRIWPIWFIYIVLMTYSVSIGWWSNEIMLCAFLLCGLATVLTHKKNVDMFGKDYKKRNI